MGGGVSVCLVFILFFGFFLTHSEATTSPRRIAVTGIVIYVYFPVCALSIVVHGAVVVGFFFGVTASRHGWASATQLYFNAFHCLRQLP